VSIHSRHLSRYEVDQDDDSTVRAGMDEAARQRAVKQITMRRHFRIHAAATGVGMVILVVIWAPDWRCFSAHVPGSCTGTSRSQRTRSNVRSSANRVGAHERAGASAITAVKP
jgi:hypothetical protein